MPEDTGQNRTEAPTPRRREEARKKGQLPLSADLTGGLLLLAGAVLFWASGRLVYGNLAGSVRAGLLVIGRRELNPPEVSLIMIRLFTDTWHVAGWLVLALFLIGLIIGALHAGFNVTFEPLSPDWERLSPARGWSRLVSLRSVVRGLMALLKPVAVAAVVWWILDQSWPSIATAGQRGLRDAAAIGWHTVLLLAIGIGGALVLLGLLDYLFQWWRHEEDLKMSRQEVKDELRHEEGDPQLRARIRKLQRERSQQRMIQDVPQATVVLTNPTHIAVALQYERRQSSAPKVVAKGADLLARRIVKVARENEVPVLERKPLARVLYNSVEVGEEIPSTLYQAIAEILAYIYRLKRAA